MEVKMKIIFWCILLCCLFFVEDVNADSISPKNPLEQQILCIFEKWRNGGVNTTWFPLPSLKSIKINGVQSYVDERGIKMTFSIGDMKLTGLNNFSVESLNVVETLTTLDMFADLVIPYLFLSADNYEIHGRAYYVYPLYGSGFMKAQLKNTSISMAMHFINVNDAYTLIHDISVRYNLKNVEADLENSSWPISKLLNTEVVPILENYNNHINTALRNYVIPYANEFLKNITLKQFLNMLADISLNSYVIKEN